MSVLAVPVWKRGEGAAAGVGAADEDRDEQEVAEEQDAEGAAAVDTTEGTRLESRLRSPELLDLLFAEVCRSGKVA